MITKIAKILSISHFSLRAKEVPTVCIPAYMLDSGQSSADQLAVPTDEAMTFPMTVTQVRTS